MVSIIIIIIIIIIIGKSGAYHSLGLLHYDRKLDFTAFFILISDHTSLPHAITNSVTCFTILHSIRREYKVNGMFILLLSSMREERWGSYWWQVSRKWFTVSGVLHQQQFGESDHPIL